MPSPILRLLTGDERDILRLAGRILGVSAVRVPECILSLAQPSPSTPTDSEGVLRDSLSYLPESGCTSRTDHQLGSVLSDCGRSYNSFDLASSERYQLGSTDVPPLNHLEAALEAKDGLFQHPTDGIEDWISVAENFYGTSSPEGADQSFFRTAGATFDTTPPSANDLSLDTVNNISSWAAGKTAGEASSSILRLQDQYHGPVSTWTSADYIRSQTTTDMPCQGHIHTLEEAYPPEALHVSKRPRLMGDHNPESQFETPAYDPTMQWSSTSLDGPNSTNYERMQSGSSAIELGSVDVRLEQKTSTAASATQLALEAKASAEGKTGSKTTRPRGPFTDWEMRQETAKTRKRKACVRCIMLKTRCNPNPDQADGWCDGCARTKGKTLAGLPCCRFRISETSLYSKGPHPQSRWSTRWRTMDIVDIQEWRSLETKTISLTQDVNGAKYDLRVREFIPHEGDPLSRTWHTYGQPMEYECTPWAIENMKETGTKLLSFVNDGVQPFLEYYINNKDGLLRQTYDMALKHMQSAESRQERDLLGNALRLFVAVRIESKSERICGTEKLGMKAQAWDPNVNTFNHVLIPPMISAQIELIMTTMVLNPIKKKVLSGLDILIKKNEPSSWFTRYLCTFILLHSCALLTAFQSRQAQKYGIENQYLDHEFVNELHHGATGLLAYFHYCNKDHLPFETVWTAKTNRALESLTEEQTMYLRKLGAELKRREFEWKQIRESHQFEHEYFFLSQLFETEWKPVRTL